MMRPTQDGPIRGENVAAMGENEEIIMGGVAKVEINIGRS